VDPKLNKIQSKQRYRNVRNQESIHNLASIHFDYQRINTILLKWILVQNKNPQIKTPQNLLLMQINPRLFTSQVARMI
jgi:hypothetical protein